MAVNERFTSLQGAIWYQPDGPNTTPYFLSCHELGDVTEPKGDITQRFCPDPSGRGWRLSMRTQGPADRPTFDVTVGVGPTRDWMERNTDCPGTFYFQESLCERADIFEGFQRVLIAPYSLPTSVAHTNLVTRETNEMSEQAFSYSSDWLEYVYKLIKTRRVCAEAFTALDVAFCNTARCAGYCGPAQLVCDDGIIGFTDDGAGGDVYYTADGGVTWTVAAAKPFGAATVDVESVACFPIGGGVTRWLVVRDTVAGTALRVAYCDDGLGTTWTLADVGATLTEAAQWNGALFALDARHIWCVADAGAAGTGNVYFSDDGGVTWTNQGAPSTDGLNYVRFIDENVGIVVGDTDEVILSTDGGTTWTLATTAGAALGNDILCCEVLDANRMWIGYEVGTALGLYYTDDGGTTWTNRAYPAPTGGGGGTMVAINDIMFVSEHVGFFVLDWTDAGTDHRSSVYRTHNGGESWEEIVELVNFVADGWHAIWVCDPNHAIVVGDVGAAPVTAMVHDLSPIGG